MKILFIDSTPGKVTMIGISPHDPLPFGESNLRITLAGNP
jgi:hypothetical protein